MIKHREIKIIVNWSYLIFHIHMHIIIKMNNVKIKKNGNILLNEVFHFIPLILFMSELMLGS